MINVFGDALRKDLDRSRVRVVELYNERLALMNNTEDKIRQIEAKVNIYRAQGDAIKQKMVYGVPEEGLDDVMTELLLDPDADGGIVRLAAKCTDIHEVRIQLRRKLEDVRRRRQETKNLENDIKNLEMKLKMEEEKKMQSDMLARLAHLMEDGEINLEAALKELGLDGQEIDGLDTLNVNAFIQLAEMSANKAFKLRLLQNLGQTAMQTRLTRARNNNSDYQSTVYEDEDYDTDSSSSMSSQDPDEVRSAVTATSRDISSPSTTHIHVNLSNTATGTGSRITNITGKQVEAETNFDVESELKKIDTTISDKDIVEDISLSPSRAQEEKELRRQRRKERRLQKAATLARGDTANSVQPLDPQLQALSTQVQTNVAAVGGIGDAQTKSELSRNSRHLVKQLSTNITSNAGEEAGKMVEGFRKQRSSKPLSLEDIEKRIKEEARISRVSLEIGGKKTGKKRGSRRHSGRSSSSSDMVGMKDHRTTTQDMDVHDNAEYWDNDDTNAHAVFSAKSRIQLDDEIDDHDGNIDARSSKDGEDDKHCLNAPLSLTFASPAQSQLTADYLRLMDNAGTSRDTIQTMEDTLKTRVNAAFQISSAAVPGLSSQMRFKVKARSESDSNNSNNDNNKTDPRLPIFGKSIAPLDLDHILAASNFMQMVDRGHGLEEDSKGNLVIDYSKLPENLTLEMPVRDRVFEGNVGTDYRAPIIPVNIVKKVKASNVDSATAIDLKTDDTKADAVTDKITSENVETISQTGDDAASIHHAEMTVKVEEKEGNERSMRVNVGDVVATGPVSAKYINNPMVKVKTKVSKLTTKETKEGEGEIHIESQSVTDIESQSVTDINFENLEAERSIDINALNIDVDIDVVDEVDTVHEPSQAAKNETKESFIAISTSTGAGDDAHNNVDGIDVKPSEENNLNPTPTPTITTSTMITAGTAPVASISNTTEASDASDDLLTITIPDSGSNRVDNVDEDSDTKIETNKESAADGMSGTNPNINTNTTTAGVRAVVNEEDVEKSVPSILSLSTMEDADYKPMSKTMLNDDFYLKIDLQLKNRELLAGLRLDRNEVVEDDADITFYTKEAETFGEIQYIPNIHTSMTNVVESDHGGMTGLDLGLQVKKAKRYATLQHLLLYEKYMANKKDDEMEDDEEYERKKSGQIQIDERSGDELDSRRATKVDYLSQLISHKIRNDESESDQSGDEADDSLSNDRTGVKSFKNAAKLVRPIEGRKKDDRQNFNGFTNLVPAPPKQPQRSGTSASTKIRNLNSGGDHLSSSSSSTPLATSATPVPAATPRGKAVVKPGRLFRLNENPVYLSMKSNLIMSSISSKVKASIIPDNNCSDNNNTVNIAKKKVKNIGKKKLEIDKKEEVYNAVIPEVYTTAPPPKTAK